MMDRRKDQKQRQEARRQPQATKQRVQAARQQDVPFPDDPSIPDIYADGVRIYGAFQSFSFVFNKSLGDPNSNAPLAVVRMSPQQTFLMTQMLRKSLKQYVAEVGEIHVPPQILAELGIDMEL